MNEKLPKIWSINKNYLTVENSYTVTIGELFFSGNGTFHIVLIKKKQGAKILNLTLDKSSSREFHFIDKEKNRKVKK